MAFQFVPNADGSFDEGMKQTNPETNQEYIFTDGAWRALGPGIEADLTELDKRYLKNEGNNELDADTNWKIIQDSKTLIQGRGGELGLYNLKAPAKSHHAATKEYVDANSGTGPLQPPGLRFKYQEGSGNPSSGNFRWYQDGGRRLNISATSQDFDWGTLLPRVDIDYNEGHIFTIWLISNGVWKMKTTGTTQRIDLHSDHILCFVGYNADLNGSLVAGTDHYITIAGMF